MKLSCVNLCSVGIWAASEIMVWNSYMVMGRMFVSLSLSCVFFAILLYWCLLLFWCWCEQGFYGNVFVNRCRRGFVTFYGFGDWIVFLCFSCFGCENVSMWWMRLWMLVVWPLCALIWYEQFHPMSGWLCCQKWVYGFLVWMLCSCWGMYGDVTVVEIVFSLTEVEHRTWTESKHVVEANQGLCWIQPTCRQCLGIGWSM